MRFVEGLGVGGEIGRLVGLRVGSWGLGWRMRRLRLRGCSGMKWQWCSEV